MERNLPATTTTDAHEADQPATRPLPARRPVSVAFLPLALATFVIVAFVIAAWTFVAGAM